MTERELRVLWLYPEHMNIYADRGNIAVLERRCAWRGIRFTLATVGPGQGFDPAEHDLLQVEPFQQLGDVVGSRVQRRRVVAERGAAETPLVGGDDAALRREPVALLEPHGRRQRKGVQQHERPAGPSLAVRQLHVSPPGRRAAAGTRPARCDARSRRARSR